MEGDVNVKCNHRIKSKNNTITTSFTFTVNLSNSTLVLRIPHTGGPMCFFVHFYVLRQ